MFSSVVKSMGSVAALAVLVVSFQNCGGGVANIEDASKQGLGDGSSQEIALVNVRPMAKGSPSEPTQVILDGYFRNGCPAEIEPIIGSEGTVHSVRVIVTSHATKDAVCTMALVPFEKSVSLGSLEAGQHVVKFESEDGPRELVIDVQ